MASSSYDKTLNLHFGIQTTKHLSRNSFSLKDYLRDDLSSCSSSGFKSMPRRQCCTTVVGFKKRNKNTTLPRPPRPPSSTPSSSSSSKTSSALHRASEALINAFKSLPLSQKSVKVKVKKLAATSFLSRSFSSSSRRFWRKARREEGIISEGESSGRKWRRSFRELLMEERDSKTTTLKNEDIMFIVNPITATLDEDIMMLNNVDPSMTTSSESWGESEFTFSSSSRSSSAEKDIVDEGNKEGATREKNTEEGVRRTDWPNKEKEQFSPVSILDCPFEDDEEITSHFNSTTEVDQHMHKQKRRHFEGLTSLEPVTLEKRFTLPELEEDEAHGLLNFVKRSIPSNSSIINAENMLLDYFNQSIEEETNNNNINHSKKLHLCEIAKDWICGQPKELYLGWGVKEGRHIYIREMDKEWKNSDQGTQEVAQELENEVLTSLVNELVLDLTMHQLSLVFSIL